MITLLRRIRHSLVRSENFRKYILYAIGEIALVVIGILIALQINTWNENRKFEIKELGLLEELKINLETNVVNLNDDVTHQKHQSEVLNKVILHLDEKKPYDDSLSQWLDVGMPAPDVILTSSAFETLKSTGLELIRSNSLRREIINLFEVKYPLLIQETKRLEDQMWPSTVLPVQQKYFRIMPNDRYVPTDYPSLIEKPEFTNMLSFRLSMRIYSTFLKEETIQHTRDVIALIENELKSRKT